MFRYDALRSLPARRPLIEHTQRIKAVWARAAGAVSHAGHHEQIQKRRTSEAVTHGSLDCFEILVCVLWGFVWFCLFLVDQQFAAAALKCRKIRICRRDLRQLVIRKCNVPIEIERSRIPVWIVEYP